MKGGSLSSYPLGKSDSLHPGKWGAKINPPPPSPSRSSLGAKIHKKRFFGQIFFNFFIIFLSISGTPKFFSAKNSPPGHIRLCARMWPSTYADRFRPSSLLGLIGGVPAPGGADHFFIFFNTCDFILKCERYWGWIGSNGNAQ